MPTIVQEFDTRQFEAGVIRVRQGLDQIEREAIAAGVGFDRAFDGNEQGLRRTADATRQLGTETRGTTAILGGLRSLLPAISAGLVAERVISYANAFNQVERAVQTVTPNLGAVAGITGDLADIAANAGLSLLGTAETFQQFSLATRELNLSQGETIDLVGTLSQGLSLFATSTSAASAAQTQLAQAFASGRLQGDEFRSVAENFPPLITAIAEVLGVARSEVRDFASDGLITSQVLVEAFGILEERLDSLGGTVERTTGQAFVGLTVRVQEFVGKLDDATGASSSFTAFLDDLAKDIDDLGNLIFPELNEQIEESADELDRLGQAVVDAGGSLDDLEGNTGRAALATQDYNEQLFEHRELLADAAEAAAKAALATDDASVSLSQGATSFEELSSEAEVAVNDVEDFDEVVQDLGISAREAAEGLADAEASIEDIGQEARISEQQLQALNSVFADFRRETEALEQAQEDLDRQGRELAETFDFIRRNTAESQREAADLEERMERLDDVFADFRRETEELQRSQDNLNRSFDDFANGSAREFQNALANLSVLVGEDLPDAFGQLRDSIAEALDVDTTTVNNALSGTLGLLDAFGVQIEDVIGDDATKVVEIFGSISQEEFEAILDVGQAAFTGIGNFINSAFSSGEQQVSSFGQSTVGTLTDVNASVGELQGALGGANQELATTTQQANESTAAISALGAAVAGLVAGVGADLAGGGDQAQSGAATGASLGFAVGGVVGAVIGGVAGGFLGNKADRKAKRQQERAEKEALREFGQELAQSLAQGFEAGLADLRTALDNKEFTAFLTELERSVGSFNEDLEALNANLSQLDSLSDKEIAINISNTEALLNAQNALEALGNSAAVAADAIADEFDINLTDVLLFFNRLPEGTADSFAQIEQNAQFIAEQLAVQFGIGIDEALAILEQLGIRAGEAFANITEPADFLAAKLADSFDVTVEEILAILGELPEGALNSFSDLATNADLIARNIAVTLGVTFEEALAIVQRFAEQAGVGLSSLTTDAATLAEDLLGGFITTDARLQLILIELSKVGFEAFDNIRIGADGAYELIDQNAQATLESIVEIFGGGAEDVQLILRTLAENSDISFIDILTSGEFAFQGLSDKAKEALTQILTDAGLTVEQISTLLNGLSGTGEVVFDAISSDVAIALSSVLDNFGLAESQILQILSSIAAEGSIAFDDLEGASGDALAEILLAFGLTEDQIVQIFQTIADAAAGDLSRIGDEARDVANRASSVFDLLFNNTLQDFEQFSRTGIGLLNNIGTASQTTATTIQAAFASGTTSALQSVQQLGITAGASLFSIQSAANSAASSLSGSFSTAARNASGAFNSILSQARATQSAINNIRVPASNSGTVQRFADGGIIEGPTLLGGAAAGQAFRTGGVLPGLTSLFGPVTPTAQAGIAGEAGREGIFPLAELPGNQLGIRGILPEGSGGGGRTQVFIINGVDRNVTDQLERQITEQAGAVEFVARQAAVDLLTGRAA